MRTDRELRIGVVGAGWAGREHCGSLARIGGARVAAVYDVDDAAARQLAGRFGAAVCADVGSLLDRGDLDAVIVATPSGAHRTAVVPALERGLAVFVEKPLARTVEDARAIADAAARTGSICAVGYQWRAFAPLAALVGELRDQELALLLSQGVGITQARGWFGDPRLSGGLLFERVSHHLDLQRKLAGEVSAVCAVRGAAALSGSGSQRDDVVSITLQFASGALGSIVVAWVPEGYPGVQSLRVLGTRAAYDVELDPVFSVIDRGDHSLLAPSGEHPFVRQLRLFIAAARAGDDAGIACSAEDAAGTVAVAAAGERALAERAFVAVGAPAPDLAAAGTVQREAP